MTWPFKSRRNTPLSPIHYAMSHRLDAEFVKLDRDKITHWLMHFSANLPIDIDDCRGGRIRIGGVKFSGSARHVYWSFIMPCLADIIDETLNAANEMGRKHSPELSRKGLDETAELLKQFGQRTFRRMVEVDRALRGEGYPETVQPHNPAPQLTRYLALVEERCNALKQLHPTGLARLWQRAEGSKILVGVVIGVLVSAITGAIGVMTGVVGWMIRTL